MEPSGTATTTSPPRLIPLVAMGAAFVVYYSMYAFRKPFSAATWDGSFLDSTIALKTALAVSQILGYATAKLIGTRVCAEVRFDRLLYLLLACVLFALGTLLALPFAGEYQFVAMFFNGLALGMIWGFVMRPLEGRAMTDFLIAGLCISFILASGDVKSTGRWLMSTPAFVHGFGGDEAWMPFLTAMIYFPFLVAGALLLFTLPRPTEQDRTLRHDRRPMNRADRARFLRRHAVILVPLAAVYFLLTAYRDFRDAFQAEMFLTLGIQDASAFSTTERYVALGVVLCLSVFIVIRSSKTALVAFHWAVILGLVCCGGSTLLLKIGVLDGYWWMVLAGLGAYVCYIAFHSIVFERLVAYTRAPGNAVFAMMLFDFIGYVAAILLMIVADFFRTANHLDVLVWFTWILTIGGILGMLVSLRMLGVLRIAANEVAPQPQVQEP